MADFGLLGLECSVFASWVSARGILFLPCHLYAGLPRCGGPLALIVTLFIPDIEYNDCKIIKQAEMRELTPLSGRQVHKYQFSQLGCIVNKLETLVVVQYSLPAFYLLNL